MSPHASKQLSSSDAPAAPSPFEEEVRAYFVGIAEAVRLPRSIAMIYASIFSSADPLCLDEVKERTGLSKGRVSEGLTFLHRNGFVSEVHFRMNRRTFYEPEMSLRQWLEHFMSEAISPGLEANGDRLEELKATCESDETLSRRIDSLRVWNKKLGSLLPVLLKATQFTTKTQSVFRRRD